MPGRGRMFPVVAGRWRDAAAGVEEYFADPEAWHRARGLEFREV